MSRPRTPENPDDVRMSLGEHLEELRTAVIRSLAALVIAGIACAWPAKYLLAIIARPVVLVLERHGQPHSLLATSPVEGLLIYIKVVLISGLILASPYIFYQLWSFVALGLYPHERRWVHRLAPLSAGLFVAGFIFMYSIVLLASLNFLVGFNSWLVLPQPTPTALERLVLHEASPSVPASQPASGDWSVPIVGADPSTPQPGDAWYNAAERKLKLRTPGATLSIPLQSDEERSLVTTHFKIGDYLSFFLILSLAFGLAFQMPLVVFFLARSGILPEPTMRRSRKLVILAIVFIAGILAPPDLLSHVLLSIPMVGLFEIGLWFARRFERDEADAAEPEA